jgi:ribosomal protein S6
MTRKYELVYVVSPEATEEQVTDLHTQVEAIVQRIGGQIEKTENWGRRRLAYEIGRHKEGTYVLEVIHGGGELMKEIERRLKVSDLVIRYLVSPATVSGPMRTTTVTTVSTWAAWTAWIAWTETARSVPSHIEAY